MIDLQKIAVMGTGNIGIRHLRVLASLPQTRAIAVPVRASRRQDLEAAGFQMVNSLQEAAQAGCIGCIVATDTGRHAEDAEKALRAGMKLLVEKPIAPEATKALRLARLSAALGTPIYVACCLRFSPSLRSFQSALPRIGKVHSVRIECQSWMPDWRPGRDYRTSYSARPGEGGVLRDLIHEIDYAGWLFGWPRRIQAQIHSTGTLGIDADDTAELFWATAQGGLVSIQLDYLTKPSRRVMRACGDRGTLEWDGIARRVIFYNSAGATDVQDSGETPMTMYENQARAFVLSFAGHSDGLPTAIEGYFALAVCDAARRASDEKRETEIIYAPV